MIIITAVSSFCVYLQCSAHRSLLFFSLSLSPLFSCVFACGSFADRPKWRPSWASGDRTRSSSREGVILHPARCGEAGGRLFYLIDSFLFLLMPCSLFPLVAMFGLGTRVLSGSFVINSNAEYPEWDHNRCRNTWQNAEGLWFVINTEWRIWVRFIGELAVSRQSWCVVAWCTVALAAQYLCTKISYLSWICFSWDYFVCLRVIEKWTRTTPLGVHIYWRRRARMAVRSSQ